MKAILNKKQHNWSGKVMRITEELGMEETVLQGESFDLHGAKEVFKDIMHQYWSDKIGNMPKLKCHTELKSDIEIEKY